MTDHETPRADHKLVRAYHAAAAAINEAIAPVHGRVRKAPRGGPVWPAIRPYIGALLILLDFHVVLAPYAALHIGETVSIPLKIVMMTFALTITAALGYVVISGYKSSDSAEAITKVEVAQNDAVLRENIQARVDALAKDGCQAKVIEVLALHAKHPIRRAEDVPPALRADLGLCLDRGVAFAYVRADLDDAGISKFLHGVE